MRKIKYTILAAVLASAATSCTENFENINSNPYELRHVV